MIILLVALKIIQIIFLVYVAIILLLKRDLSSQPGSEDICISQKNKIHPLNNSCLNIVVQNKAGKSKKIQALLSFSEIIEKKIKLQ